MQIRTAINAPIAKAVSTEIFGFGNLEISTGFVGNDSTVAEVAFVFDDPVLAQKLADAINSTIAEHRASKANAAKEGV